MKAPTLCVAPHATGNGTGENWLNAMGADAAVGEADYYANFASPRFRRATDEDHGPDIGWHY